MGIKSRPLISTIKGLMYDKNPLYEFIYRGNQTVIEDYDIINALYNSTYNMYVKTNRGVQKIIFTPK